MRKDVDPNESGSFDQMSLISLIARKPKTNETLEEMIEAIKVLVGEGDEKDKIKIPVEQIKYFMASTGEKMPDHEIENVLADCADL